jgi:hypothetical protein
MTSASSKNAATQAKRSEIGKPAAAIKVAVPLISINLKTVAMRKTAAKINRAIKMAIVRHEDDPVSGVMLSSAVS